MSIKELKSQIEKVETALKFYAAGLFLSYDPNTRQLTVMSGASGVMKFTMESLERSRVAVEVTRYNQFAKEALGESK